ncbi:hypothetical protein C475_06025 [Halosimplex carlsbadense 2-9-1]|uniref:Uncharacterized protein n=1 Tax=Halosimplex carlsbadense 2-9-1 TaxID=797114 RepID=M0CXU4_9EURY|nr:hypothetical protein [Halosimplex carlsbadense]ELZ27453.1 hypothetical protein C475_06025 [Halosimplex carlsbadense 2-9-1]
MDVTRALLGDTTARGRRWLIGGLLSGTACSALAGVALPNPGIPRYVGVTAQCLLVATSVALLALGFGVGVVLLADFALLFPAYYVRAQAAGAGFRTPVEQALPQAATDAALVGVVGLGVWLAARRAVDTDGTHGLARRPRSE